MKKLDLHIHTVPTLKDAHFDFSMRTLERYVSEAKVDAIAITNHDVFDADQYREIRLQLQVVVFPGVEVSLDCGHVLVISDANGVDEFRRAVEQVTLAVGGSRDSISIDEFEQIFCDLSRYLVIPHYGKSPAIGSGNLERMCRYVSAGEVDSAKKFIRAIKNPTAPTPVLFSDVRIRDDLGALPTRQTFVDCGELSLAALKSCLSDKGKVALSESDGNDLIRVFEDGQMISTGLNVLLGGRSSGKTHTLNRINELHGNTKYIEQFSLVQQDRNADEREFNRKIERNQSQFTERYLSGFKAVLNDVQAVDLRADDRAVAEYIESLKKSAEEADKQDAYSKTVLFDESEFPLGDDQVLVELIGSVRQLIENIEYREVIERHADRTSLQRLACELISLLWTRTRQRQRRKLVNGLIADVKARLKLRTSAVQVSDVDLYRVSMNKRKVARFERIVKSLQEEATISEEPIQGFKVVTQKGPFAGAGEVKTASGVVTAFQDAYSVYDRPYEYLQRLLANESLKPSELYKLFVKITCRILNRDGFEVSGGERSEFRLLQEIADAQNYDFLLIDEPESSFDNPFLKSDVNQIIKEISLSMPVVLVTHNSTVGASIRPDYVLYASKDVTPEGVTYRLFSGHPMDPSLRSLDGKTIRNCEATLNSLEAGRDAYIDRRRGYEALEDQ